MSRNNKKGYRLTGTQFLYWRLSRGLTQKEVALWLGTTYQNIQHIERAGCGQIHCLAIAALERGLKPWQPSD